MTGVLLSILAISVLAIIHESGHYLAARAFGMQVTRFSIGLGPTILKYQPKGSPTTFQICAIPVLAYVAIAGMNPAEDVDPADPSLYPNKGVLARIVTIAAGPFANYLTASVLAFAVSALGYPFYVPSSPMIVDSVEQGTPAAQAGIRAGDVILEVDGQEVRDVREMRAITRTKANRATTFLVSRNGHRLPVMRITPKRADDGGGVIGVRPKLVVVATAEAAVQVPYIVTRDTFDAIVSRFKERSVAGISGPVGMVKAMSQAAKKGPTEFFALFIFLSVALGFFNLLPFPALDGGRLVFLAYEVITRRRPNERFEAVVHTVGLLILLGFIVFVTLHNDT